MDRGLIMEEEATFEPTGLGSTIWRDRYARSPEETWQEGCFRVAEHVAQAETNGNVRRYSDRFYQQLVDNKFNPGGRIWYGAGRPKAQLLNCFVIPTADSREGWGRTTSDTIIISGLMGGVGMNMSPIRPRGSAVKGTGGVATGAVSFMQLIDGIGDVIAGGGGRRMALMLCLNVNHPDLEEFLSAKLDKHELNNANISVVIPQDMDTEEFVSMVVNNEEFELMFNGVPSGKSMNARVLWDILVKNAWESGEPGVLNGFLANKMNNIYYYRPLISTNPCVTGDTWVLTEYGPRQAQDILGTPIALYVDGKPHLTNGFFETGTKDVYNLLTKEGQTLRLTADHQIMTDRGWVEAQYLVQGDKIHIHNHDNVEWDGSGNFETGYAIGHWLGDGTVSSGQVKLQSWGDTEGEQAVRSYLETTIKDSYSHRSDFKGWIRAGENSKSLVSAALTSVVKSYFNSDQLSKQITKQMLEGSSDLQRGILSGLFDTDGHVEGNSTSGGVSIRLSQSSRLLLESVQRMLLNFGVRSKIQMARADGVRTLPDGKGGVMEYECASDWRLIITSDAEVFMRRIGFVNTDKVAKFHKAAASMVRGFYNKPWTVTFDSLELIGAAKVYDVQVPNVNAFDANGLYVHNCGEIWLEEYGCCDLGSLVLPRFVKDGTFDWDEFDESVRLAVRFLDNVLDINHYPLPEIKENCENVRRIGLGVMGLHTMLLELGMRYDSEEAFEFVDKLFNVMKNTAYDASINLAIEKGPFPAYDPQFLESGFVKTLKRGIRNKIREHGIRNCALLMVAPTGTTSMVSGVTSGLEPVPAIVYWRNFFKPTADGRRELTQELVVEDMYYKYPDLIQSAIDVSVEAHFRMQQTVQKHVDNAVSKTINLAENFPQDAFGDIWLKYLPHLKGTTVYRFGSRENEPIQPIPREQWDLLLKSNNKETGSTMSADEFLALDCPDGVCELPQNRENALEPAGT